MIIEPGKGGGVFEAKGIKILFLINYRLRWQSQEERRVQSSSVAAFNYFLRQTKRKMTS